MFSSGESAAPSALPGRVPSLLASVLIGVSSSVKNCTWAGGREKKKKIETAAVVLHHNCSGWALHPASSKNGDVAATLDCTCQGKADKAGFSDGLHSCEPRAQETHKIAVIYECAHTNAELCECWEVLEWLWGMQCPSSCGVLGMNGTSLGPSSSHVLSYRRRADKNCPTAENVHDTRRILN